MTKGRKKLMDNLANILDIKMKPSETTDGYLTRLLTIARKSYTLRDLACICSVGLGLVDYACRKYEIRFERKLKKPKPKKPYKRDNIHDYNEILRMVQKTKSVKKTASILEISITTLYGIIAKLKKKGKFVYLCSWCEKQYHPKSISSSFCSEKCFRLHQRFLDRVDRVGFAPYEIGDKKECPVCGHSINVKTPYDMLRKYCSEKCTNRASYIRRTYGTNHSEPSDFSRWSKEEINICMSYHKQGINVIYDKLNGSRTKGAIRRKISRLLKEVVRK